jgi:hypothetical protein
MPFTDNDIESELSYAYLHAVAARAGMECQVTARHSDNKGVDARVRAWGPFNNGGYLSEVNIDVQLKATTQAFGSAENFLRFEIQGIERFDRLRDQTVEIVRLLVVLFLPKDKAEWLSWSPEELIVRQCAYWICLRGMPETGNRKSITIKIPRANALTPDALAALAAGISRNERPGYRSDE